MISISIPDSNDSFQSSVFKQARLNLKRCKYYEGTSNSWNHQQVIRPWNCIYCILGGDGKIRSHGKDIFLKKNHAYLMPLGKVIDLSCQNSIQKYYMDFTLTMESGEDIFASLPDTFDLGLIPLKLHSPNQDEINPHSTFQAMALIYQAISSHTLIPHYEKVYLREKSMMSKHAAVFKYLNEHDSASTQVSDIARFLKVSLPSLSRAFKRDTGMTLKQVLNQKLNQKALQLLISTHLSIEQISSELGFENHLYFYRFFKKINNLTPTQYRESRRLEESISIC